MCDVINEIITEVTVNIFKPLLPYLISQEHLGFVEGRQITDGIILVHEILYYVNTKKILGMMVKLDIAKAYDKIRWQFMRIMLTTYGFWDD